MRSELHGPEEFLLKSKKPRIQELVAKVDSMSIEEIESLDEKSDIKRGLINIKKKQGQDVAASIAEHLADLMIAKHHPELARQVIKN
jgi:hypothetical protein